MGGGRGDAAAGGPDPARRGGHRARPHHRPRVGTRVRRAGGRAVQDRDRAGLPGGLRRSLLHRGVGALSRGGRPVTTWAAAAERLGGALRELTVRNVVRTTVGGTGLRVRLTNAFGDRVVTFGAVYAGVPRAGAALEPGSNRRLLFGGRLGVSLAPGATVLSDPLPGVVGARQRLAVSVYLRGEGGVLTGRNRATAPARAGECAASPAYRSVPGDHAGDGDGSAYEREVTSWHWLDAVTLCAPAEAPGAGDSWAGASGVGVPGVGALGVAVLGDSIATGVGSETGHGWPDLLADRAFRASWPLAVANEGVSGGCVLTAGTGRSAEERLTAEVLTKPGIGTVILAAGINDLGAGARAEDLVAAYRRIVATAHAAGVGVVGATLTPFAGAEYHTPAGERARQAVNAFVREGGAFDGLADFDAALRDLSLIQI
ncbi:SGNH/GDSL hydrolase family protein [Nonomuraea zeae]|uniref:SGNH/GDSL hydrolase family protein n=1 Tax=Nonomuraea zeae TaxID=1642303 RepID=A0A5S4FB29_9ACTN|nr:SGNH/GDSL hydrolase family protein [Nonomuraea zeae]